MNRLFEALSDAEMDQPSPKAVQRAVSPPTVIRLDVRAIGIARLKSSQELESEQVSPEDIPQNVSPFDLTPILAALEAETEQVSLKAIPHSRPLVQIKFEFCSSGAHSAQQTPTSRPQTPAVGRPTAGGTPSRLSHGGRIIGDGCEIAIAKCEAALAGRATRRASLTTQQRLERL